MRQTNTNNLLTAVGQVLLNNGNFTLAGQPVTLQGGLSSLAGNNTWAIGPTLAAAQSFISSNGTLTVSGVVTNGGYALTLDGAGSNVLSGVVSGTGGLVKNGVGTATLSGASTFSGSVSVNAGTLAVQNKSGDVTYAVAQGATLKIGYSTGGSYANTAMTLNGNGVSSASGLYLQGGANYNASGQIQLLTAPTTIRQYGSGLASIGTYDINGNGLWCSAAASGSAIDPNIQLVCDGFGMSLQVDAGANTATGDLTLNGPLNVGNMGFYKRGAGSLVLNGTAASGNTALNLQSGSVICGAANCIGASASLPISSGATLLLNGFSQTVASFNAAAGSTLSFGGTSTLTVSGSPVLAGALQMVISKGATPASSRLVVSSGTLTNGGSLTVTSLGTNAFAAGDTFTLFSAASYAGAFTSLSLPALPLGLVWITNNLPTNGTLVISTNSTAIWNGGGANGNWNTAANWVGTVTPSNGQSLTFQGTLRQSNTNNLLTAVGQVVFTNGGFALWGNPVTLQWGLVNQAGNNAWAIASTLAQAQPFVSSNGTLTVSGAVASGGFSLTLDGAGSNLLSGVVSGAGGLVKNGAGTAALSVQSTYTGGTTVNGGILNLTGGGGSSGTIRGTATINTGGTLQLSTTEALGYGGGASALTVINLVGGTLNVNTTANQTLGSATLNLTGGAITGNAGGNLDFLGGAATLNTLAASTTATISGVPLSPLRQGSTTFTVAAGTTPSGIDLDISSVLHTSPSGDATGAVLTKAGPGTLRLSATNTYARATTISAGTLLVNGSLATGKAVTVASGGTLGGAGVITGPTTVQTGGTFAPGIGGIGRLTISNSLVLAGQTVMEISKNGGVATNDLAFVSGALTQGGSLTATNIGTNALAAGDSFKLFSAGSWSGAFTNLSLPALANGLNWNTNTLATNGTLAVAWNTYTLIYAAGSNGTISGSSTQTVNYGGSGSAVGAVANGGCRFVNWSDGGTANPRTDANVTNNLSVTANFVALNLVPPMITNLNMAVDRTSFTLAGTGAASRPMCC